MDLGLKGKNVLITGGSKGIGLAAARTYVEEGARVGLIARGSAGLAAAAADLEAAGGTVHTYAADVTDDTAVAASVDHLHRALGSIDVVVHSAGSSVMAEKYRQRDAATVPLVMADGGWSVPYPFSASTMADWQFAYDVNVLSAVRVLKAVLPIMRAQKSGRVVLVASLSGKYRGPGQFEYAAAKAAEVALANCIAGEVIGDGILVNSVCPTTTLTDAADGMAEIVAAKTGQTPAEVLAAFGAEKFPLGRMATAEEVGDVIVFLTSNRATYITGTSVNIDGGTGRFLLD